MFDPIATAPGTDTWVDCSVALPPAIEFVLCGDVFFLPGGQIHAKGELPRIPVLNKN